MIVRRLRVLAWMVMCITGGVAVSLAAQVGTTGKLERGNMRAAIAAETLPRYRIHDNGHFRATVTNWGVFGHYFNDLIDSSTLGTSDPLVAPGFESPPYSQIDYLYDIGLWVGGIVAGDTLVSTGSKDYPSRYEMHPADDSPPIFTDSLGDEEYRSVYSDTLTDPTIVLTDEIDGPHRPLPVHVDQVTRLVTDPSFNTGMIVEVTVTNIGSQTIQGMWIGWAVDADVGKRTRPQYYNDDLSGFRSSNLTLDGHAYDINAAYSIDNDGDPDTTTEMFDSGSARDAMATMYLESEPPLPLESFNWWVIAFVRGYDWGPSKDASDSSAIGGYGRTTGDAMRYRRMANQEIDYPQVFAATDQTADGWIPPAPPAIAAEHAAGQDTRFLHARGTIDLAPGASVHTVWVFALGNNVHTDPTNFADNFSPLDPQPYMDGLDFAGLDSAMARMQMLWDSRFHDARIGAPRNLRMATWDDATATIAWQPRGTKRLDGYKVYRSLNPASFSTIPLRILDRDDSVFTDAGLGRTKHYYYTIRSVDSLGRAGTAAPAVDVIPDRPDRPVLIQAERGDGQIRIKWLPPAEPDVVAHRVYRRLPGDEWLTVGTTYQPGSLLDLSVTNATEYEYRATAISQLGTESFPSPSIRGIAFSFSGAPLVIDRTLSGGTALTIKDSVAAVWQRLTAPIGAEYRDANPLTTVPFGLDVYDPHPAVIAVTDSRGAALTDMSSELDLYAYAGGALLLTGRDVFNGAVITGGTLEFAPGDLPYDDFGILRAYYPRVLLSGPTRPNAEFIAARSTQASLPDLHVDPSRTDWGLNPALPSPGNAIPFVGYFEVDTTRANVLYTYVSRDSLTSSSHGKPVAVMSKVPGIHGAVTSFPFSYMQEPAATATTTELMRRLGWVADLPGDLDGDGQRTPLDLSAMIDYIFFYVPVTNENNVDVNGDCRASLVDVVWFIDYLFFGSHTLLPGCINP